MNNDQYGRTVTFSSDGNIDTYTFGIGTVLEFPAGTSLDLVYCSINSQAPLASEPTLSQTIACNVAAFQIALSEFVNSQYTSMDRLNLIGIYINAVTNNLTNRQAYLAPLLVWQNSVILYASSYITSVEAMTDPNMVLTTVWSFDSLAASNPNLKSAIALQISN